jgi:ribonuclease T2
MVRISSVTGATLVVVTLFLLAACAPTGTEARHGGGSVGKAGDFDTYVFAQSWSAEFCHSKNFPGCQDPTPFMQNNLTTHGLWPQYDQKRDGRAWPQFCKTEFGTALNKTVIHELSKELKKVWPVEQGGTELWGHEWTKHGTCSGLSQMAYFKAAIATAYALGTPPGVSDNIGGSVSTDQLMAYYAQSAKDLALARGHAFDDKGEGAWVALACSGDYLKAVSTCWNNKDNQQVRCPSTLRHSCSGDKVRILSFSSSDFK